MPSLTLTFDLLGTFVFALSGALLATRKHFDIVGVVVLSLAAGLGGGMTRDVLLGARPPVSLENQTYLLTILIAGLVGFLLPTQLERAVDSIRVLDALGLGFFALTGTLKALEAGLGPVSSVLLGVLTGCGGGLLRDLLASETPLLLHRDIYALAAAFGAAVYVIAIELDLLHQTPAAVLSVTCTVVIRLLAIRYQLNAPRPPRRGSTRGGAGSRER